MKDTIWSPYVEDMNKREKARRRYQSMKAALVFFIVAALLGWTAAIMGVVTRGH